MTFTDFYMVCLIVGFTLAALSLFLGIFHVDLPGTKWDFLTGGHLHGNALLPGHGPGGGAMSGHFSAANFSTLMVFLAWFGGAGALLTGPLHVGPWLALPV